MLENIKTEYVVRAEYKQEQLSYQEELLNRCPNVKDKDGRIHYKTPDGKYIAVMVSPYHKDFRTQIEDKVWPIVNALLNKNYLPISCCEGHVDPWKEFYFTVAFDSSENALNFVNKISHLDTSYIIYDTIANISQTGSKSYRHVEDNEKDSYSEILGMNTLLFRDYKKYFYVRIEFNHKKYALPFNPFNVFSHHSLHKKAITKFESWKKEVTHIIENELDYYNA